MPNDYFRFKQFLVKQDKCAMKVCTDACLFGAWAAHSSQITARSVLDIGCGTGLLSLMFAQRLPDTIIDVVEIDEAGAQQARENFDASPWKERLNINHTSIQQFADPANKKYDIIISNPPFYENDLRSDDAKRNLALHSAELKLEELINVADLLLNTDGNFFVLLPYYRTTYFENSIEEKFFIKEKVLIKQTPKHNYFRSMLWLTKNPFVMVPSEIIIMNGENEYSDQFKKLLKEYYLNL
jgi:tRNA1Val (adenine37-N6)-methyltransferase